MNRRKFIKSTAILPILSLNVLSKTEQSLHKKVSITNTIHYMKAIEQRI